MPCKNINVINDLSEKNRTKTNDLNWKKTV